MHQSEKAITVYNQALEYCNEDDLMTLKISVLTNIGVIYFREKNFINALKYFLSAYDLNKKSMGQVKLTSLLVNIGLIYLRLEVYDKAIYYLELSLTTIPKSREYAKITIYNNLISTYSANGEFQKAKNFIEMSRTEVENYSQADEISFHRALAFYYTSKKEYLKAIEEYYEIISKLIGVNYENERTNYKILIANNYSDMSDFVHCKELIDDIDKHIETGKEEKIYSYDIFLEVKVSYYKANKDYESALIFSSELLKLQKDNYHTLEQQIVGELANPLTNYENNISNDAYEDKINELQDTNKELNEQKGLLVHSLNDLRNESNLREKIISIISHDLRAPIGNIIQLLEMFDEYDDDNERDEIIEQVIEAMKQAFSLTNELVDWAKEIIDAQKLTLSDINVKEVVTEIEALYKQHLDSKHIILLNNLSEEKNIISHKTSIKTCFRNIIQNAIKFSEAYTRIEINEEVTPNQITYSIKDNGRGISPEKIKSLFDVKKISTLGTNQETGIGIGLLLVKELIVKNNGEIRCESILGEGTTFFLSFPLALNDQK